LLGLKTPGVVAACVFAFSASADAQGRDLHPAPIFRTLPQSVDQSPFEASYPLEEARRRHLEGRVLIGFHIDDQGNTFDQAVIQSEADSVLAQAALRAVQNTRYEMKWLKTDASLKVDPQVTYLMTVIYCLGHCERFEQFPDTDTVEYFDGSPPENPPRSLPSRIR
jgi:TonB family protein